MNSISSIAVTRRELDTGRLEAEKLAEATRALREDGIVVLEDIVDLGHVDLLRDRMFEDVERIVKSKKSHFNWHPGNVQQEPPPFPPYLFRDVLANDIVIQVNKTILGPGQFNAFYSGNTAMPSDKRQPAHADLGQLWPDQKVAHPAQALVVNMGMVDMSPENGSTEIWVGTHMDASIVMMQGDIEVPPERLEARRKVSPPIQPTVRRGSAIIRDMRLWHAGMPNRTQTPRPMIAMIHYVGWWPSDKIKLHSSAEELLQHPDLRQHAEYSAKLVDRIKANA